MNKLKKVYDYFAVIFVIIWAVAFILNYTLSVEILAKNIFWAYIALFGISWAYAFAVVDLAIHLSIKEEVPAKGIMILLCIIVPFIIPILFYVLVLRKLLY